jgi:probable F420-dependent oxidoreductase
MTHPFRFGVQISALPTRGWREVAQRIEALGYSTLFFPDHFSKQWEPATALAAVATATERLNVGALVYDVDYRHPVVYAKAAATLQLLSEGRHEFGIGAGWMESDYLEAGMRYDRPGLRISRLEEALQIILSMWQNKTTTFEGEHYKVRDIGRAAPASDIARPRVLIGGGGERLLSVAGRYADIVGINPSLPEGRVTGTTPGDLTPERVRQKIGWVRKAADKAGRNPDEIEFNSLSFVTAITDEPGPLREGIAQGSGMTVEEVADCPLFLTGSATEICDRLEKRRTETGISYVVIQGKSDELLESFAEQIVAPLTGR